MTAPRFRKNRCFTESTLRSFASFRMTSEGFSMTLALTLSPEGVRDNFHSPPSPSGRGRVRECNEVEKKQTIFSLEEQ
jgi:hypothetical protein